MLVTGLGGRTAKLAIYNRWGNKVFTGEGGSLSWDGKANTGLSFGNGVLPAATYYYTFEFLDKDKRVLTGFVALQY